MKSEREIVSRWSRKNSILVVQISQRHVPHGSRGEDGAATGSLHGALAALQTLLAKLEDYDTESEELLDELIASTKGTEVYESLMSVRKRVGQYDFEAAAEELKPIIDEHS